MASNNITSIPVAFDIEPDGSSSSSADDLLVNMLVVHPEHPEEEESMKAFRVPRMLLSSEESSTDVIPKLLSHTSLPEVFHQHPLFIKHVSEYVCSLPSNTHTVYFYHVVADADPEARQYFWDYFFSTDKLNRRYDIIYTAYMSEHWLGFSSGRILPLNLDDEEQPQNERNRLSLESTVEALKEVQIDQEVVECAICLQGLLVAAKLPCSHVYHRSCVVEWFVKSDSCPLCRRLVV
jgi:hypothetical protein